MTDPRVLDLNAKCVALFSACDVVADLSEKAEAVAQDLLSDPNTGPELRAMVSVSVERFRLLQSVRGVRGAKGAF